MAINNKDLVEVDNPGVTCDLRAEDGFYPRFSVNLYILKTTPSPSRSCKLETSTTIPNRV